ncbi:MAG TPA: nodulation protein NfeD [Candidatus Binatia bacterium]|nr:nodulation protein NfeD [Candidatus Binatia bacterium]
MIRERLRRTSLAAAFGLGCLGLLLAAAPSRALSPGAVPVLRATGVVDNVLAGYIEEGIALAAANGAPAVVIVLNTPGGSLDATNKITSTLLEARVPTIVWVAPAGGQAASAGTFITLAAHVAFMAPGTRIGAASPVGAGGEDIEGTLGDKVRQDAIAAIRAIAETRGRNVEWAVSTVAEAKASPASEAVEVGAVDGLAASLEEVRRLAEGRMVRFPDGEGTIRFGEAPFEELPMNPFQSLLHLLSDPNIAFVLFTVGFYGLLFELQNPNFVTGILGALAIILAFIGFGSLPLNVAGLLLIGLAIVLFVLEIQVASHGLLTVGGLVAFVLGASALYTAPGTPTAPDVSVALPLVLVMSTTTALFMALIVYAAVRTRRMTTQPGLVGAALPLGVVGQVRRPLTPIGSVYAAGEEWSARALDDRPLERGTPVRIVRFEGLTAIVEPAPEATSPEPAPEVSSP